MGKHNGTSVMTSSEVCCLLKTTILARGGITMVFCKTQRFPTANQDHRVLPRHSNNFALPFHRLAVLVLRGLDHSMSARFAILPKQRQPDSIAGPLGYRPRRLIYALAIIVDLGSLRKAVDVSMELLRQESYH